MKNAEIIESQEETKESYLIFQLGKEMFASHVSKVERIIQLPALTKFPNAPNYLKGIILLNEIPLPIIDTRIKFGMPESEITKNNIVIVLEINTGQERFSVGALVDSVQEMSEFNKTQILPIPAFSNKYQVKFIKSVVKSNKNYILILDIDQILNINELNSLSNLVEEITKFSD